MRVIAGQSRGRRLSAKLPAVVRPTSDRVKESIFDILGSQGGVDGLFVVDLFCGSGGLGVEALSRGAAAVTFVDQDLAATVAVRENLEAVGLADTAATIVRAALPGWVRTAAHFDLALCDPPYGFEDWPALLADLDAERAVLESTRPPLVPEGWMVTKERRYGGTLVTVAQRSERDA